MILGAWQLSKGHRSQPTFQRDALDVFSAAVEHGLVAFDCADIYSGVEELLGELIRRVHKEQGESAARSLRIHTKLVPDRSDLAQVDKAYVSRLIDRSLTRLGVDCLDLVQYSWWDYGIHGYVEVGQWLHEIQGEGKILHLGATNLDTPRLREVLEAGVPLVAHQVQYSLLDRRPDGAMVDLCSEHNVALLCYGTLAGGFLSERWLGECEAEEPFANRSLRKYSLVIQECGGWDRFQGLLSTLNRVAENHDATIAQIAIAWVLSRPLVGATIVGASSLDRLLEASRSLYVTLDQKELVLLERWADEGPRLKGDCFELERMPGGPHAGIMKYDLNQK